MGIEVGKRYREFVNEGIGNKEDMFRNVYAGFILGNTNFIKARLDELKEQVEGREEISHKAELGKEFEAEEIIGIVSKRYNINKEDLVSGRRRRSMKEKKVLIYLLRKLTGLNNREIGMLMGMKYSAVSKAGLSIERMSEKDKGMEKEIKGLISNFEV